jgi:hypothetical protein
MCAPSIRTRPFARMHPSFPSQIIPRSSPVPPLVHASLHVYVQVFLLKLFSPLSSPPLVSAPLPVCTPLPVHALPTFAQPPNLCASTRTRPPTYAPLPPPPPPSTRVRPPYLYAPFSIRTRPLQFVHVPLGFVCQLLKYELAVVTTILDKVTPILPCRRSTWC